MSNWTKRGVFKKLIYRYCEAAQSIPATAIVSDLKLTHEQPIHYQLIRMGIIRSGERRRVREKRERPATQFRYNQCRSHGTRIRAPFSQGKSQPTHPARNQHMKNIIKTPLSGIFVVMGFLANIPIALAETRIPTSEDGRPRFIATTRSFTCSLRSHHTETIEEPRCLSPIRLADRSSSQYQPT